MKTITTCIALALSIPFFAVLQQDEKPKAESKQDALIQDENAVARRDFMRTKLMYSQQIFRGLTLGDFIEITDGIKEVEQVTAAEQWIAVDNPTYKKLTGEFKSSITRLKAAAKTENVEATVLRFYEMSNRCIDCHQHLRQARYEF